MEFHRSETFAAAGLPFSESVRVGDVLYLSGCLGNQPGTKMLVPGGLEAQAHQTMRNIAHVLGKHGLTFDEVFKCQVMLADMSEWEAFNPIYMSYFKRDRLPACPPARPGAATGWRWAPVSNWNAGPGWATGSDHRHV
jgi:2-iminobutanoate/2-iminopropanoate deaminase